MIHSKSYKFTLLTGNTSVEFVARDGAIGPGGYATEVVIRNETVRVRGRAQELRRMEFSGENEEETNRVVKHITDAVWAVEANELLGLGGAKEVLEHEIYRTLKWWLTEDK